MKKLARKNILNITPYKAGKPIEETKRELGLKEIIKLASNENPLGPSPKAVAAIKKNLGLINRYPDSQGFYLKKTIAAQIKARPENIVLANGSDEAIDTIIKTFAEEDENIVTADTTFLEYEIISKVNGRKVATAPLKNFKFDLAAIAGKINSKTKLVFIANPNNPTGTYVNRKELESFLKRMPKGAILVLDEAYDAFIDVKDYPNGLDYINKNNVIVLKTFSKAYGLAGLRIGYAAASAELASCMEKARQPFNVNLLAQAAAAAALSDKKFLRNTRGLVLKEKYLLYSRLQQLGLAFVPSVANFILIDTSRDGVKVFKAMLKEGVIVRDMQQYGLKNFIRVTIGKPEENRKFIKALKKVLGRSL
ncbi:MAG: histidinol-phosphate transaminase [Candidatus Omnitrophica bacterium]|nr:histidinol-phosphate transaminase [Candidatus Omnitrophota bacterium]